MKWVKMGYVNKVIGANDISGMNKVNKVNKVN